MTAPARAALVCVPGCPVCQRLDAAMGAAGRELSGAARVAAGAKFTIAVERAERRVRAAGRSDERSREAFAGHLLADHDIDVTKALIP